MRAADAHSGVVVAAPSTFVTVVAWLFIIASGLATFVSLMQAAMMFILFSGSGLPAAPAPTGAISDMPAVFRWYFEHPMLFFASFWLLSVCMLVAAIGLLRRRNWARLLFIGLMVFGVAYNLAGIWLAFSFAPRESMASTRAAQDFRTDFDTLVGVFRGAMLLYSLVACAICIWIARRLTAAAIKAEFRGA